MLTILRTLCMAMALLWTSQAYADSCSSEFEKEMALAEQADADAMVSLYLMYLNGSHGVPQDRAKAYHWIHEAAYFGDAYAQYEVGKLHTDDLYTDASSGPDFTKAIMWFLKAAEQSDQTFASLNSQYELGQIYSARDVWIKNYRHTDRMEANRLIDIAEAMKWYRMAAARGHAPSQTALGEIYRYGLEGIPKDFAEAIRWYRLAIEQDDGRAMNAMGEMYERGSGVRRNYATAKQYYRQAINNYYAHALVNMGMLYYRGRGVRKDYPRSNYYFYRACDAGVPASTCNQYIGKAAVQIITSKDKARARELVGQYKKRKQAMPKLSPLPCGQ